MDDRQITVEEHDVVLDGLDPLERGRAVVDDVDGHALTPQAARDRVGELSFVFDEEYTHPIALRAGIPHDDRA